MKTFFKTSSAVLGVLLLSACSASTGGTTGSNSSSSVSVVPPVIEETSSSPASNDGAQDSSAATASSTPADTGDTSTPRVVTMSAENWKFSESTITAKKGERLVLRVTAKTGTHGIGIRELGINVIVNAGETKDIEIPTDKVGTFTFFCSVPCGPGHKDMTGEIVIS